MADLAQPPMFGDHTTRLNDACKALCRQAAKLLRTRPAATAQVPDEVRALPERWRTKKRGLSALGCANELALALAAPAAPKGVVVDDKRTIYDQRTKVTEACERAGPLLYTALKNLLEAVRERDLQQSIESVVLSDADMALAAARNPELQP